MARKAPLTGNRPIDELTIQRPKYWCPAFFFRLYVYIYIYTPCYINGYEKRTENAAGETGQDIK
jgi:hypothetical protein